MEKESFKGRIIIGFDFRYTLSSNRIRGGVPPMIYYSDGDYKKEIDRIKKAIAVSTKEEILKIIFVEKDINFKEIENILNLSHSALWEHINNLESLGLIKRNKIKKEKERKEYKLSINPNVEIIQSKIFQINDVAFFSDKYNSLEQNKLINDELKKISKPNKKVRIGIVTDKGSRHILSKYKEFIRKNLLNPKI